MFYDLFDAVYDYCSGNVADTLQFLSDLHNELKNNSNAIKDFIEEYIEQNNLCPDCFNELESIPHKEYIGDFGSDKAYQTFYEPYCPRCDVIDEEVWD
jgi:uncharacterized protein with PIN domain